jgi:hypothetical protein
MSTVLAWIGFAGAWLLVAGPVYQAALELDGEEIERDQLAEVAKQVAPPPRPSPWWWLLPPVAYVLQLRRNHDYRQATFTAMSPALRRQFVSFTDKAAGWVMVAAGALLLAVVETWNLGEELAWPPVVRVVVIIAAALLAASYTAGRMRRTHFLLDEQLDHASRPRRR